MTKRFEDKVAIVTGSGIGVPKGIAVGLAREGAKVITNNRKPGGTGMVSWLNKDFEAYLSEEEKSLIQELSGDAETTADQIIKEGGEAIPVFGDMADWSTAENLIKTAMEKWGRVDIVVNGGASGGIGPTVQQTEADWGYQTDAKLKGTFATMVLALPIMMEQKFGRFLNVSSDAWVGLPGFAACSAANAGIIGMTKAVAKEVWGTGITVNAICPRAISRSHVNARAVFRMMCEGMSEEEAADLKQKFEEEDKEAGPSENLAPFLVYLATEEAEFISGSVFTVTARGRINLYSEFSYRDEITKKGAPWTVDELMTAVPEQLLKDYVSIASTGIEATEVLKQRG